MGAKCMAGVERLTLPDSESIEIREQRLLQGQRPARPPGRVLVQLEDLQPAGLIKREEPRLRPAPLVRGRTASADRRFVAYPCRARVRRRSVRASRLRVRW